MNLESIARQMREHARHLRREAAAYDAQARAIERVIAAAKEGTYTEIREAIEGEEEGD